MRIYLIRHGRAHHNEGFDKVGPKAYRDTMYRDSRLTTAGHDQTIGKAWDIRVERVYCSPLFRCIQTARNMFGSLRRLYLEDGLMETKGPQPCNLRLSVNELGIRFNNITTTGVSAIDPVPQDKVEDTETLKTRADACFKSICEDAQRAGLTSIAIVTHHDWLEALTEKSFKNAEIVELDQ
jgi:broad specificity phosphatase PhoE